MVWRRHALAAHFCQPQHDELPEHPWSSFQLPHTRTQRGGSALAAGSLLWVWRRSITDMG